MAMNSLKISPICLFSLLLYVILNQTPDSDATIFSQNDGNRPYVDGIPPGDMGIFPPVDRIGKFKHSDERHYGTDDYFGDRRRLSGERPFEGVGHHFDRSGRRFNDINDFDAPDYPYRGKRHMDIGQKGISSGNGPQNGNRPPPSTGNGQPQPPAQQPIPQGPKGGLP